MADEPKPLSPSPAAATQAEPSSPVAPAPAAPLEPASLPAVLEPEPRLPETLLAIHDADKAKLPALSPEGDQGKAPAPQADGKPPAPAEPAKPAEAKTDAPEPAKEPAKEPVKEAKAELAPFAPIDPVLYGELILPSEVGDPKNALKVTPDPELMTKFKATLGENGVRKEAAQPLLDLYVDAMSKFALQTRANQFKTFGAVVDGWALKTKADADLGGAGHETTMGAIARMRDRFVSRHAPGSTGYVKDMADLGDFLATTGGGSHPAFLRLLHNVARMFDEPQIPQHVGQPTKQNGSRQISRLRDTYDHPRSDPSKRQ